MAMQDTPLHKDLLPWRKGLTKENRKGALGRRSMTAPAVTPTHVNEAQEQVNKDVHPDGTTSSTWGA